MDMGTAVPPFRLTPPFQPGFRQDRAAAQDADTSADHDPRRGRVTSGWARIEGVDLVGPGGLPGGLTKRVLAAGLGAELTDHPGYDEHDPGGRNGGNSRNGTRSETVITEVGLVELAVPCDRDGSFEPIMVRTRERRLGGVDELVIWLTATGFTTG
jgi:putative transposase